MEQILLGLIVACLGVLAIALVFTPLFGQLLGAF